MGLITKWNPKTGKSEWLYVTERAVSNLTTGEFDFILGSTRREEPSDGLNAMQRMIIRQNNLLGAKPGDELYEDPADYA